MVDQCIVHDISDKGVSVGEGALDVTIHGSVFYNCGAGVAVKDNSVAHIFNNTIVACEVGIELVEKIPDLEEVMVIRITTFCGKTMLRFI
ncbi:MAG: right-handed parallel beta-helix repeat-containing protein [Bacteroidetes bacterium]|nr:right-handed parallel beta-helix repeat-containing protein [Bacteroidota bacterium]